MYSFRKFRKDDIVVLLGAGASIEADIPHSGKMIENIERKIGDAKSKWSKYQNLYYYLRSAIHYSAGIHGRFNSDVNYNIEKLIDTLNEISKHNQNILYPFVGAWNPRLIEVAGKEFELAKEFRDEIVGVLRRDWLAVQNYGHDARYYGGLVEFQSNLTFPLRVFTLNYDLCVEKIVAKAKKDMILERGFDDERKWDWRQFDENENDSKNIYLYKLHGSMDWAYEDDKLTYSDDNSRISEPAIIFGTSYKLEYRDPFLFLAYEFRRWTLEAQIIIVIGYGFGDEHINMIIQQALNNNRGRILLVVMPLDGIRENDKKNQIASLLDRKDSNQIKICDCKASKFMEERLNLDYLRKLLPEDDDAIPF